MKKAVLATAVSLAISGTAHASFEQYRAGFGQSVHEVIGNVTVSVDQQEQAPSAWFVLLNAPSAGAALSASGFDQQLAQQNVVVAEEAQLQVSAALTLLDADAEILTTTKNLAAGLVVNASAEALYALQNNPLVASIMPLYDSELHVADSAEYIKAVQTVQSGKATGEGVRVAVLDTGIDYTHAAFGGPGTAEAYAAANANQTTAPNWPQGQVVGGFDFMNMDPNPLDTAGHGTSVAHSVTGIAPDVQLYAYSVCAGGCPALAQIRALEASMDPNGDGNLADRVDIINMSLGGQFGSTQTQSGTQFLIQRAAELGVNMVISAGNDGNVPFRIAGPSTTPNALSVGAMTHPTVEVGVFDSAEIEGETVAMVAAAFNPSFDFAFNSADTPLVLVPGAYTACDALPEDADLTGKAVLVSRGVCAFSQKVLNAQARGAAFVIIANSNPGQAPIVAGGDGTGIEIPTVMITKEVGDAIRDMLLADEVVSYDIVSSGKSGAGAVAGFTSRGPAMDGLLKPEITAPGVSIQVARVGTGTENRPVNGTSFSGPITAGAAALVREALPERNAFEVKATMMNTANMTVHRTPIAINPDAALAPISMIGAGLVDVEKAVNSPVAAWVYSAQHNTRQAALSFGLQTLSETSSMTKTVTLKNFSNVARTYNLSIADRFADKTATGALSWQHPAAVTVQAGQTINFDVTVTVDPAKLPEFNLTNGVTWSPLMAASQMDMSEFDGALIFNDTSTSSTHDLHLVYHFIPKAAGKLALSGEMVNNQVVTKLTNTGVIDVEPFASTLVATSPANPTLQPINDIRAITLDVAEAPWCAAGYALYPTFHMEGGINHLMQGNYAVDLDINNDGFYNFTMNTLLVTRLGANYAAFPGVMVSFNTVFGTTSGALGDVYHYAGGKQVTLESCFNSVGLTAADIGRTITARFRTDTNSFSLNSSFIADQVVTPLTIDFSPEISLVSALPEATPASATSSDEDVDTTVEVLAPGQSAYVIRDTADNRSFVMMSGQAEAVAIADLAAPMAQPVVAAGQMLSVNENTANGTVIGQVSATADFRTVITEFVTLASSSSAIVLNADGSVAVANSAALDYEAGMTEIRMEVAALDAAGNMSAPQQVVIKVNNIADENPTMTVVAVNRVAAGTPAGAVVGSVNVVINEAYATLASISTNNPLFAVNGNNIIMTRAMQRGEGRSHSVIVTARDSAGLQATQTVTIIVDAPSSGGSTGLLGLLLLPLVLLRRRFMAK